MCFLSTTFPNAPAHPPPPILFDQSLTVGSYALLQVVVKFCCNLFFYANQLFEDFILGRNDCNWPVLLSV